MNGRNPWPRLPLRPISGRPAGAGCRRPSAQRARLGGSRRPGPGRAATRCVDHRRAISRHLLLPAIAPGEATRADFMQDADISPVRTTGPEPRQPVRAQALSGHTGGAKPRAAGDGASRPPGGKRSAQRRPRRAGVRGLKPQGRDANGGSMRSTKARPARATPREPTPSSTPPTASVSRYGELARFHR